MSGPAKAKPGRKGAGKSKQKIESSISAPARGAVFLAVALFAAALYSGAVHNDYVCEDAEAVARYVMPVEAREDAPAVRCLAVDSGRLRRPALALSFWLAGGDAEIDHAESVVLHGVFVFLLCAALWIFFRNVPMAAVGALIFAAHPVHVEAVSWAFARSELLASVFGMAGCLLAARAAESAGGGEDDGWRGWAVPLCVGACWLAALLSSERAILLPAFFALFAMRAKRPGAGGPLLRGMVRLAVALVLAFLFWGVHRSNAFGGLFPGDAGRQFQSASARWLNVPWLAALQFKTLLAPYPPMTDWTAWPLASSLSDWRVWVGVGWALFMIGGALGVQAMRPAWTLPIAWFALGALPCLNFFPQEAPAAERFLYWPSVAVAIAAALLFGEATTGGGRKLKSSAWAAAHLILLGAFLAGCLTVFERAGEWKDDASLWNSAVRANSRSVLAWRNAAAALQNRGAFEDSGKAWLKAVELAPDDPAIKAEQIGFLIRSGQLSEAEKQLAEAASRSHENSDLLFQRALLAEAQGRGREAEEIYRRILNNDPNQARSLLNLADLQLELGAPKESLELAKKALEIDPRNLRGFRLSAMASLRLGNGEAALETARKAARLNPHFGRELLQTIQDLGKESSKKGK